MSRLRILPPANVFVYAAAALIMHFAVPIEQILQGQIRLSGILLILLGAWFAFAADRLFKQRQTTVKSNETPAVLVREGPFRVSRNPMYLGMVVALIGEAILLGSVTPFLAPLAFFLAVDTLYVALEEKQLTEVFGDDYSQYKSQVRRWI